MTKYNAHSQEEYLLKSNLLGAQSIDELERLERVAFYLSSSKVEHEGFEFLFPLSPSSLEELHRKLFQNIYDFAGEIRDVSLMKAETRFCEPQFIREQLKIVIGELNREEHWGSSKRAAKRLAYYKTELNMVHPFREGNGRTLRVMVREIAKYMGFTWDFEVLNKVEYLEAMKLSQHDNSKLEKLFLETLSKVNH